MPLKVRTLDNVGVEVSGFDINAPFDDALQAEFSRMREEVST